MTTITITDGPCGYEKTTDILASFKPDEKYIVVLPFLSEVGRVIKGAASKSATVLHAPLADHGTKTDHCSDLVKAGKSIACTHALFPRLGTLATEIAFETSTFMCVLQRPVETAGQTDNFKKTPHAGFLDFETVSQPCFHLLEFRTRKNLTFIRAP